MDNYGLTEAEKNFNLHEYNHALFNNMKAFMDACWEINVQTGTAVILHENFRPSYVGQQFEYGELLKEFGENHIYPLERGEWYENFSLEALSRIEKETTVNMHFVSSSGIPEIHRIILTPAKDAEGVVQRVYLSAKNVESDIKMLREMQEEKQIIFSAMSSTYPIIIYSDLSKNTGRMYMLSEHRMNSPMAGSYDSIIGSIAKNVLPKYREDFRDTFSRSNLKEMLTHDGRSVIYEYEAMVDDAVHWLSSTTVRIDNPYNSDFMAITLTAFIDEKRKSEYVAKAALQDAYHAAADAGKAKTEFLSRMSHDMLTPLNTVQCLVSLGLKDVEDTAQCRRVFQKIGNAGRQLNLQITRLLDSALLETESMSLSEEPAELTKEFMSAIDRTRDIAVEKDICVDVSFDEVEHNAVMCDIERMGEIFEALISNAFKFTGDGGSVSVTLREGQGRRSGFGYYEFTVKDNGIGIPEDKLEQIFEPFERLEDPRVSRNAGSGLGLYIARNITKVLGGNITVRSEPEKGSEFTAAFFLKLQDPRKYNEDSSAEPKEKISFAGKRILVVEDNELNNEIIAELLEDMDFKVESAYDGKEAVDIIMNAEEGYYDAVLMDIMMPVMDGCEAASYLRNCGREDLKTLPIIAASANSYPSDIERSLDSGMNDHLSKPIESVMLAKALDRCINKK